MPRRKNYPTISEGADGKWHAWVSVTRPDGTTRQRHIKRATEAEVEKVVDELLDKKKAGAAVQAGRAPTLEQWLTTYLDTVAPRRVDPTTVKGYRSKMWSYVVPVAGKVRMDQLQPHHLDAVYLAMQRARLADSTTRQVHRILSRALEIAYRRGLCPRNPAKLLDAPTAKPVEIRPPDEAAAGRLLEAASSRRNKVRWKIGLGLGLRQGEALGLRWSYLDIDSSSPHINVHWQLHRRPFDHGCGTEPCGRRRAGNCPQRVLTLRSDEEQVQGGLILKRPKGKSMGTVPLPPEFVAELKSHREVQNLEKMMAGDAYLRHGFVFADRLGGPVSPEADWREWQELEKEAGVEGQFRPHDARHFAGTFLLAQGVDVRVVQEILRHSSVKVTEGYTHVASQMARDAVERAGRALPKSRTEGDGR